MGIRLYQGGTFISFEKSPGGTIIPGGTFIRESRVYLEGGADGPLRSKIGFSNLEINKKIWVCQIFLDTQTDKTSLSITNVETFLSD